MSQTHRVYSTDNPKGVKKNQDAHTNHYQALHVNANKYKTDHDLL